MPPKSRKKTIKLEIPSDIGLLKTVQDFVGGLCAHMQFSEREKMHMELCVSELVTNAIYYGNKKRTEKRIQLIFHMYDNRLEFKVRDEGAGFDLANVREKEKDLNFSKSGGRGIFLVDSYMDKVRSARRGKKFEISVTKYRQTEPKETIK